MKPDTPPPHDLPPIVPGSLIVLIQKLLSGEILYARLSPAQKDFIGTVQHRCPGCGKMFDLYDRRQGIIRHSCSRKCQGIISRNPDRVWTCAVSDCGRRFRSSVALQMHIDVAHPGKTLHQYLEEKLKATGGDPATLVRFCPECGKNRRLNFEKETYDDCHCVNSARRMRELEDLLAKTTDETERQHIQRQIRGCKSVLTRMRPKPESDKLRELKSRQAKTKDEKGQIITPALHGHLQRQIDSRKRLSKISSKKTELTAVKANSKAMPAAPPPTKSLVTVEPGFDFENFSAYFDRLLPRADPVFKAYYHLIDELRSATSTDATKREANTSLHELLQSQGWITTLPQRTGYWAFVFVFSPDISDFSAPTTTIPYFKELPGDPTRISTVYSKLSYVYADVGTFLRTQQDRLPYVVTKGEAQQAFYRIVETAHHFPPKLLFNIWLLYQLDLWYGETPHEETRPETG